MDLISIPRSIHHTESAKVAIGEGKNCHEYDWECIMIEDHW